MVNDDLGEYKLPEILNPSQKEGVKDGHQIEKAYEIVEIIRQGNEEELLFRNLEKESNREKKAENDDATNHRGPHFHCPFDLFHWRERKFFPRRLYLFDHRE